jgi:hypothetical protein
VREHVLAVLVAVHVILVALSPLPALDGEGALARAWNAGRDGLQAVAFEYGEWCGTHQWWSMFSALSRHPRRLEIAVRIDGEWRDAYIHGTGADWNAAELDRARWREMILNIQSQRYKPVNRRFIAMMSERLFARYPRADRVRVQTTRATVPPPQRRREVGLVFDEVVWKRERRRPR